jgi:DNA-binding NtrC family response regulator
VVKIAREKSLASVPRFERSARDLFRQHSWDGNFDELSATVHKILRDNPGDVITYAVAKSVLNASEGASPRTRFESHLSTQQVNYIRAASILLGGDHVKTARFFGTEVALIDARMK